MTIKFQAKTTEGFTVDSPLQPLFFPDSAAHITGADYDQTFEYQIADIRGMDHNDLFLLAMWAEACASRHEPTVLLLPYLPGARMDRGVPNLSSYTQFVADQIDPDQLITIDPHSPEWLRSLREFAEYENNVTVYPVERIIRKVIQDKTSDIRPQPYAGVIAPDKGAHDRAAAAAKLMGVPVYTGGKTRDFETGKLTGFHMEDELPTEGKFLIVDDICDGGGTFIGLAQAIREKTPNVELDLWVTHGIFSKEEGVKSLLENFGVIHTTNSYFDPSNYSEAMNRRVGDTIKVHDITPHLYGEISL